MKMMSAVLLLAGAAFAQEPSSKGVNSLAKERELGQSLAAKLDIALPLVHEPKLDAYIAQLGAALAKYADSPFTYTFTLYEDRRPGDQRPQAGSTMPSAGPVMPLDAFRGQAGEPVAVAGGPIFIPMSLLASAPNEAVFAFQLAHAMAHTASRHRTRMATRTELMGISTQVAQNAQTAQNMPTGQRGLAIPMGWLAFSRASEREADYVAAQIVHQAGYSPAAMAAYLSGQPDPKNPVFSAHPTPSDRAKAIRSQLERLPPATYTAATGGFDEAKALAAPVR
ncbi:MAG: M48 family metalloprotease [Bryobacteraceae bacterium]